MKLLITAGPTREPIDAVRFISNRSSGRMGFALASAAVDSGHKVTLLLGPGLDSALAPVGAKVARFETTDDLQRLLEKHFPKADVLIMAAAVSDYRPVRRHRGKIARGEASGGGTSGGLAIEMEPTPDLVAAIAARRKPHQRIIGFALETRKTLEKRAVEKLHRKQLDAIIANPLETMDGPTINAVWLDVRGGRLEPGEMPKPAFGRWVIQKLDQLR